MSGENYSQMSGELETTLSLEDLSTQLSSSGLRVQVRESSHYEGGRYIRVNEGAELTLERIGPTEYLSEGEAPSVEQMYESASTLSWTLTELDLRHGFEIYDSSNNLAHYLHHRWPEEVSK